MPLDADRLANSIVSKLKAAEGATSEAQALPKWKAIAEAIVGEIKDNAVVSAAGADPQGGSQSVTGTVS